MSMNQQLSIVNSSQLAKNEKAHSLHAPAIKFIGRVAAVSLTAHNWQKWKEYSWHVPAIKFIGIT